MTLLQSSSMNGIFRLPEKKTGIGWLLLFGLVSLFLPIAIITGKVLTYTHGVFMYPFDDTFIHLTIADNLTKGTWGINQNQFASASSSVLYTIVLAVCRIFCRSSLVPFAVNCLAGIFVLLSLHFWLRKHLVNSLAQGAIFLLVIFFTPLPLMIISGMEHTLQCLFSFLFIAYFSDWLQESNESEVPLRVLPMKVLIFAVLASTIRYEGLFLIAIACVLLAFYKRILPALVLGLVAVLPLVLFGLISVSHGNYFLPNSVLVKSGTFNYAGPLRMVYDILFDRLMYARNGMPALASQRLLLIIPMVYLLFKRFLAPTYFFILVFVFGAAVLQLSFASTGYLYRYEAYLFFCAMVIIPVIFYKYGRFVFLQVDSIVSRLTGSLLVFFLFFPVVLRSVTALDKTAQACINIYDQQYQMALFTNKFYNGSTVALNDIGAVGYFTGAKIVDMWGLASPEVAKSKKQHYWTGPFLNSLVKAEHVQFSMIYDSWFPDSLSKNWSKAATWKIQNNIICGDSIVSFYSINPIEKPVLQERLRMFQGQLPASVVVKYY
jgi:hypothetical protein